MDDATRKDLPIKRKLDPVARLLRQELPALSGADEALQRATLKKVYGLTDSGVALLLALYGRRERARIPDGDRAGRGADWSAWSEEVLRIRVNLQPGGRAVLHEPGSNFRIEYAFLSRSKNPKGEPEMVLKGARIVPDDDLALDWPDLHTYGAALALRLVADAPKRKELLATALRSKPLPGKAPDTYFYKALISEYDRLIRAGAKAPVKEIAATYGVNENTVKSWLARGRRYLTPTERTR